MDYKTLSLILVLSFTTLFSQVKENKTSTTKNQVKTSTNKTQATVQKPEEEKSLVKWMTLQEALEKQKTQPKKIFMDVYTDWCGWCKHMMKTTFSNPSIAGYINQYYYPVRFNGETKDTIEYKGKTYYNTGTGRSTHQLALKFTNNRPSYPTIVYFDEVGNVISPVPGYMDIHKIEPYLVFFTENVFRTTEFGKFKEDFDKTFVDSLKQKSDTLVHWYSFDEAQKLNKENPKTFLIDAYNTWTVVVKVMDTTTFSNKKIAEYINKNYYAIKYDMFAKEPIDFFGKHYTNDNKNVGYHNFGLQVMNKKMVSPSLLIFDSTGALLSHIPGYFTKDNLYPVLYYFAEKKYKTQKWADFAKEFQNPQAKPQ